MPAGDNLTLAIHQRLKQMLFCNIICVAFAKLAERIIIFKIAHVA